MAWKENILFKGLSEEELSIVERAVQEKHFQPESTIINEGDKGTEIYFIKSGKVEILKNDWIPDQRYRISTLQAGEVFGEMALVGDNIRHASVKAIDEIDLFQLSFKQLIDNHPEIASKISKNLNKLLTSRLSATDTAVVSGLKREFLQQKKRAVMSSLVVKVFTILALYLVIVQIALNFVVLEHLAIILSLFMLGISRVLYGLIKETGYPIKMYGLTCRKWKKSVWESIVFSIPILLIVVLMKYLFIQYNPDYAEQSLFNFSLPTAPTEMERFLTIFSFVIYILFSPAQEFIFRGVLQSALQRLLTGRRRIIRGIIVSNLIFLMVHFHFDFAFLIFPLGIFWGWLFLRHRTLIGVSLSHMLIGFWTFYAVGLRP